MEFKPKSLRRRRNTNKWECVLTHTDPLSGKEVQTYHTIEGKTRKQAEQARCDLIIALQMEGFSASTNMTILEFMEYFLEYKIQSKTVELSTIRGYRIEMRMMCKYIGVEKYVRLHGTISTKRRKLSRSRALLEQVREAFM